LEPRAESTPETRARPATAVTPAETQPQSSEVSSESALGLGATDELATNPESTKIMLGNRGNSPIRRFSSRRRVARYKHAPRTIKALIEMWFLTLRRSTDSPRAPDRVLPDSIIAVKKRLFSVSNPRMFHLPAHSGDIVWLFSSLFLEFFPLEFDDRVVARSSSRA
jgi:hypothetical protein